MTCPDSTCRWRCSAAAALLLVYLASGTASATARASSAPFIWQVRGAATTHYLVGSMHMLPKSEVTLPAGIRDAFADSRGLVFETDIHALADSDGTSMLLDGARAPDGLAAEVDPETAARVRSRARALKMPAHLCERHLPWFCALSLEIFNSQRAGLFGEYGLDRRLHDNAIRTRRTIRWFESPSDHVALFTRMPKRLSRQLLDTALADGDRVDDEPLRMYRAWRDNDVAYLTTLTAELKQEHPELHAHLLARRNAAWLPELRRLLSLPEPQMIVVGAAHWLGPDGLIAALENAGFEVRAVEARVADARPRSSRWPSMPANAH